jgi:hypothetical protein
MPPGNSRLEWVTEWPVVWVGCIPDKRLMKTKFAEIRFGEQWQAHKEKKAEFEIAYYEEGLVLRGLQEQYCQYEYLVEMTSRKIYEVVEQMVARAAEGEKDLETETEDHELMSGLENTLRAMLVNATQAISNSGNSEKIEEIQHWARREASVLG